MRTGLRGVRQPYPYLTAKRDEAECLAYFGDAYARYMQRSRMFTPRIIQVYSAM